MNTKHSKLSVFLLSVLFLFVPIVQADGYSPENMTCAEFTNLNPKAMSPVALWILHDKTIYKGGDTVDLKAVTTVAVPQIIKLCQEKPNKKIYDFKSKLDDLIVH